MGIAIRKWVTWHGIALNVCNDLRLFHAISPCGFTPEVMSRLADLSGDPALRDPARWRAHGKAQSRTPGKQILHGGPC